MSKSKSKITFQIDGTHHIKRGGWIFGKYFSVMTIFIIKLEMFKFRDERKFNEYLINKEFVIYSSWRDFSKKGEQF